MTGWGEGGLHGLGPAAPPDCAPRRSLLTPLRPPPCYGSTCAALREQIRPRWRRCCSCTRSWRRCASSTWRQVGVRQLVRAVPEGCGAACEGRDGDDYNRCGAWQVTVTTVSKGPKLPGVLVCLTNGHLTQAEHLHTHGCPCRRSGARGGGGGAGRSEVPHDPPGEATHCDNVLLLLLVFWSGSLQPDAQQLVPQI